MRYADLSAVQCTAEAVDNADVLHVCISRCKADAMPCMLETKECRKLTEKKSWASVSALCRVASLTLPLRAISKALRMGAGMAGMPLNAEPKMVSFAGMPNLRALTRVSESPASIRLMKGLGLALMVSMSF